MTEITWLESVENGPIRISITTPKTKTIDTAMILLHGTMKPEKDPALHDSLADDLALQRIADDTSTVIAIPLVANRYYITSENTDYHLMVCDEIPQFLYERYHTKTFILSGISMGAYGAILHGASTDRFQNILAIAGDFISSNVLNGDPQVWGLATPSSLNKANYLSAFMPLETLENSPTRNAEAAIRNMNPAKHVILICGKDDERYQRTVRLTKLLEKNNIPFRFFTIDGDHDRATFKHALLLGMTCISSKMG